MKQWGPAANSMMPYACRSSCWQLCASAVCHTNSCNVSSLSHLVALFADPSWVQPAVNVSADAVDHKRASLKAMLTYHTRSQDACPKAMADALVEAATAAFAAQPGVDSPTVQTTATCSATAPTTAASTMRITGAEVLLNGSSSIRRSRTVSLPYSTLSHLRPLLGMPTLFATPIELQLYFGILNEVTIANVVIMAVLRALHSL